MKTLLINTYESKGGAAIAAKRMYQCLNRAGFETSMMVAQKTSNDNGVIQVRTPFGKIGFLAKKYIDLLPSYLRTRDKIPFYRASIPGDISKMISKSDCDLLFLHWITGGFFRLESLANLKKPIAWFLHDWWPFTGGCHFVLECNKFEKRCGTCPVLKSEKENDLSRKIYLRKKAVYDSIDELTLIVAGKWMEKQVKKSSLLGNREIYLIPIPIDTDFFKPIDKRTAKKHLGLNTDKKYFLFGAVDASVNRMKGFDMLINALNIIEGFDFELLVFGAVQPPDGCMPEFPVRYFGVVKDLNLLVNLYSASDVFLQPSKFESFGMTALESLSCCTPVVGFNIGGVNDIVDHQINGYLANPFEIKDFIQGIHWVLENDDYDVIAENGRKKVEQEFSYPVVAERLNVVFQKVINKFEDR